LSIETRSEWWNVVQTVASYVAFGHPESEIFEDYIREALAAEGYSGCSIDQAMTWLEQAAFCGNLPEVLGMLQPASGSQRIANPLETVCVTERLWQQIESIRQRGLISSDVAERLVEGIRSIDTRDWDESEIRALITEVMSYSLPHCSIKSLEQLLKGKDPHFYC